MSELVGRRVLVVGLARAGSSAAEALLDAGAEVIGFDVDPQINVGRLRERGVEVHLEAEEKTLTQGIDLVVKSPGVRADVPLVAAARARGIPVWDELELGARLLSNPMVAVTGTNGKTTTTALLGEMFRADGRRVEVGGNIGRALSSLVGSVEDDAWIVCEVGVFQLDDMQVFHPRVGVLVNLEPDHLDRYERFEDYAATKLRMFALQTEDDTAVVPRGFRDLPGLARVVEFAGDDTLPAEPAIPGAHNRQNAAAATAAARAAGVSENAIARALSSFPGVEHRIEEIAKTLQKRHLPRSPQGDLLEQIGEVPIPALFLGLFGSLCIDRHGALDTPGALMIKRRCAPAPRRPVHAVPAPAPSG